MEEKTNLYILVALMALSSTLIFYWVLQIMQLACSRQFWGGKMRHLYFFVDMLILNLCCLDFSTNGLDLGASSNWQLESWARIIQTQCMGCEAQVKRLALRLEGSTAAGAVAD